MSTNTETTDKDDATEQTTDFEFETSEVTDTDLTPFQVHCLFVIRGFESGRYERSRGDEGAYGLDIKRTLERAEWYGEKVHHGRLYPNLTGLIDHGLLEKGELDKRTNYYALTEKGTQLIARKLQRDIACLKGNPHDGGRA